MSEIETVRLSDNAYFKVWYERDAEPPLDEDDSIKLVVLHRRYADPSEGRLGRTPNEVEAWEHLNQEEWATFKLWMYDHGSVALGIGEGNPFSCPWDSGRVGIVAVEKSEFPDPEAAAIRAVDEYSSYINGSVYYVELFKNDEMVYALGPLYGHEQLEQVKDELERNYSEYTRGTSLD